MQKLNAGILAYFRWVFVAGTLTAALPVSAAEVSMPLLTIHASLSLPAAPVVVSGGEIASLLDKPVAMIRAVSWQGGVKKIIPFQIDKRDAKGRYVFPLKDDDKALLLEATDECVFMLNDAGERLRPGAESTNPQQTIEIGIVDFNTGERKWVYLQVITADTPAEVTKDYVVYDAANDTIETGIYRIGFSKSQPFLIDKLQWHVDGVGKWSPNVVDTMKIRHHGKLLGIDFVRTQADYRSRIIAVKDGPVRVIRRTLNSVKVLGYLQSPSLTIDYVIYANGLQMDTLIDLPFKLSWFFSDLSTLTTIDWNDAPPLPALRINSAGKPAITINGEMNPDKEQFNKGVEQRFGIESAYGLLMVQLELEKNLPVEPHLYLLDDRKRVDEPENIPGQFGNVGFLTTGWEKVDTSLHHLMFNVLVLQKTSVGNGLELLGTYPVKKKQITKQ
ncbi:hypothetical protein [Sulfurirhabdus autotrophica]|nr:hypothetical protein [Sulfurirhabdus autotrophica]